MGDFSWEKAELASYQLREVTQVWYTQSKDNRLGKSGPIEWEEYKETFPGKYFPRERREVKVDDFINRKEGNMSVEKYSLKFDFLSRYAPSIVSNSTEEMSRFVTGVTNLVREKFRIAMLHDDLTLDRIMVYTLSIEEFKLCRISRNSKRSGSND